MKNLILLTLIFIGNICKSQIAIEKSNVESASSSIEFGGNRGLVLPWVTSAASITGAVNGTMIFDTADKKVKIFNSSVWKDLSILSNGIVDTTLQDGLTELPGAKISIGTPQTSTPGILVLEDTNKAMILPKVANPHLTIVSPAAGMMVYDTVKKMLLVFNGTVWTFWKAS